MFGGAEVGLCSLFLHFLNLQLLFAFLSLGQLQYNGTCVDNIRENAVQWSMLQLLMFSVLAIV